MKGGKVLVIFESVSEILTYISKRSLDELKDNSMNILAIQPDAQAYLKRRNISYINTTGLFSKNSHQRLILKSAEIIEPFRKLLHIEDNLGIKEGYNNAFIFYLRQYFVLYLLWLVEVIDQAVEALKPESIITVKNDCLTGILSDFSGNDRLIGIIVEKVARKKELSCEICRVKSPLFFNIADKSKVLFLEIFKLSVFYLNLFMFNYKSKGRKFILSSSNSYNLEKVIEPFLNEYNNVISVLLYGSRNKANDIKRMLTEKRYWTLLLSLPAYFPGEERNNFSKTLNETVKQLKLFFLSNKQILKFKGIDFSNLIFEKIEKSIIPLLSNLHGQTYYLNKFIKKKRPALIISQMARGMLYNLAELAGIYNIPSILVSHGSHVPISNKYEDVEYGELALGLMNTHYKYLAIQSPWALDFLKKKPSTSVPVITGPLLFAKLRKNENQKYISKTGLFLNVIIKK